MGSLDLAVVYMNIYFMFIYLFINGGVNDLQKFDIFITLIYHFEICR